MCPTVPPYINFKKKVQIIKKLGFAFARLLSSCFATDTPEVFSVESPENLQDITRRFSMYSPENLPDIPGGSPENLLDSLKINLTINIFSI